MFFSIRTPGEDDKKVRFGYVILNPVKRGLGYGKEMLKLGLKFAFDIYGADEVGLGVFDNNMPDYHCYKKEWMRLVVSVGLGVVRGILTTRKSYLSSLMNINE